MCVCVLVQLLTNDPRVSRRARAGISISREFRELKNGILLCRQARNIARASAEYISPEQFVGSGGLYLSKGCCTAAFSIYASSLLVYSPQRRFSMELMNLAFVSRSRYIYSFRVIRFSVSLPSGISHKCNFATILARPTILSRSVSRRA